MSKTKKEPANRLGLALVILGAIGATILWLCALAQFSTALLVIPLFIVLLFAILVPSVCTLFIIWSSEGYRNFISGFWNIIVNISTKGLELLQNIFPYVAAIAGAISIAAFVLSLVFFLKHKENHKAKPIFIASAVILGLVVIGVCVGAVTTYVI